jgi:UDPglucose--hexose-1-phosphate uridylyltransferase
MVRVILRAIEAEHPRCAYNLVLQTSHFDHELPDAFHWRLKVIPRLSKIAGFEWSSDCFINTVLPEAAAQSLRNRIQTLEVASTLSRVTPVS